MSIRDDVHRPSVIVPSDYDFVGWEFLKTEGLGDAMFLAEERARIRAHMQRTDGSYSRHAHGGNCHICGSSNAVYTCLFHHVPSNDYVRVGTECAEKLEHFDDGVFRRKVKDILDAKVGKRKASALLADKGLGRAYEVYESEVRGREEDAVRDIVGKLVQYGDLTEKKFAYLGSLLQAINTRAARRALRMAESELADPLPPAGERIEVIGTLVTRKKTEFGPPKIMIKADAGWKVWGNEPSALSGAKPGDRVSFIARIAPSKDDPKFGFFSRPTKARLSAAE